MKTEEVIKLYKKYVMNTYTRVPISLVKGKGTKVIDLEQNKYLDFFPGWGVSILGHCPPKVVSHVKDQVRKLIHVSNNYYNHLQAKLAKMLVKISGIKGKVFFCNSGAEANEAAFKLARLYGEGKRSTIVTMFNSFHGRTLGCISATGQEKYKKGFEPLVLGFIHIPFNDIEAFKDSLTENPVAVILELIQGEGGINVAQYEYVMELQEICKQHNILIIVDEVQTGMGRTGKWFAYQHYDGFVPDIITIAKGIAGGLPMGAMIARNEVADYFKPGMHASTFGGGPLVSKAALGVIDTIMKKKLLKNTTEMGKYLFDKLKQLKDKYKIIKEVRGLGLMLGMELEEKGNEIYQRCLEKRLLLNLTQGKVLRIMPPLNVTRKEIDKAVYILDAVFKELS
jgi:predicted acetylornithine/succinylornithine family transaminase